MSRRKNVNRYERKMWHRRKNRALSYACGGGNFKNNKLENLELLCPNCHSLTSSYRSLNRGQGRPGR